MSVEKLWVSQQISTCSHDFHRYSSNHVGNKRASRIISKSNAKSKKLSYDAGVDVKESRLMSCFMSISNSRISQKTKNLNRKAAWKKDRTTEHCL